MTDFTVLDVRTPGTKGVSSLAVARLRRQATTRADRVICCKVEEAFNEVVRTLAESNREMTLSQCAPTAVSPPRLRLVRSV